jgi:uncharacterized protein YceH (UPF0502 family)
MGDLQAVEVLLHNLADRDQPLVMRLPRQPGRKEQRFTHLLSGIPEIGEAPDLPIESARMQVAAEHERIGKLEEEIVALRTELDELRRQLQAFRAQFE